MTSTSPRPAATVAPAEQAPRLTLLALRRMPLVPLGILLLVVLVSIFAPLIAPHDSLDTDLTNTLAPPAFHDGGTSAHLLGTDKVGRDVFSRVIYGGRVSLTFATGVLLLGGILGVTLGLISGHRGGWADAVIQRAVEAILSLPTVMVALVFVFVVGQSLFGIICIITPFVAASFARMVRGETLAVRESGFVALAKVAGASGPRIMLRHVLPNVASTIIVLATLEVGSLILLEASLSFLGVGVPPPSPCLGLMVADGQEFISSKYWLAFFPGMAIVLIVLAINWLGDWLRDTLDPKRKSL